MHTSAFVAPARQAQWFFAGLASSFPNITEPEILSEPKLCRDEYVPGAKVFRIPSTGDSSQMELYQYTMNEVADSPRELKTQVLVFQYKGKFHAMDNHCPHSSSALSLGSAFDIEDFGIVLSAGITCPKHGWSFDLFSGQSDRSAYKLKLWEVQIRATSGGASDDDQEVWIRRKQRMG